MPFNKEKAMSPQNHDHDDGTLNPTAILIHLGLMLFGLSAAGTGLFADDYKRVEHTGFLIHSYAGIGLAVFAFLRLITGFLGPRSVRFTQWMPVTPKRIGLVIEDIRGLLKRRLPDRPTHQGLAGVVQTFGLAVFFLMAATGIYLYFTLEPGRKSAGFTHDVKELHELCAVLIPAFLSFHVGAVIMHAFHGKHIWKKIFFISDTIDRSPSELPDAVSDAGSDRS